MPEGQGPATTRRRLRFELRRLREEKSLRQDEVVDKLDWSLSKLIRIENGSVGVSVTDVRALLGIYGAPTSVADELVALARSARQRRWWSSYRDILNQQYQEFIGFEADAARLRQFHPSIVPGLLQTETYIRAMIPALALSPLPEAVYESLVQVRLRRQQEILDSDDPPEFVVVIDEAALRRPVGGLDAMRDQLRHIAEVQSQDTVTLGILPFSAGPHVGMQGAFHIMEFAADEDDDVLYLENALGDVSMRDRPELVSLYSKHLDTLLERSIKGETAVEYLAKISDELT
jgi:transcriptional regulator with XRE-family HTH domain